MKRFALLLPLLMLLTACGAPQAPTGPDAVTLLEPMLTADNTLPEMYTIRSDADDGAEMFDYLFEVDYGNVDSYFLAYSATGLADQVGVFCMKDAAAAKEMAAALQQHVEERVRQYSFYQPREMTRAQDALIFTRDNYAVLLISDGQSALRAAFDRALAQ